MRLYVEPMDAVVVEVAADGRVRLENEDWTAPTLQERRAIIYAASVNTYVGQGDIRGAREASNNAKMWCWISFWLGLVPLLIAGIWLLFAAVLVSSY